MEVPLIHFMQYNGDSIIETEPANVPKAFGLILKNSVNWINIYGLHDIAMMESLGECFDIPPLLLEDILNTDQTPKYQSFENFDVFIIKMLNLDQDGRRVQTEQISLLLGEDFIITLQEKKGDVFTEVRNRIRNHKGRIRSKGNDYLAYALMDTIVDNYFHLTESFGKKVEDLEDKIFQAIDKTTVEELYKNKLEINSLRRSIRPMKEVMVLLLKNENSFFKKENKKYLVDLNELVIQVAEVLDLYNNLISDQLNIYNANAGNRMNEVMKTLTIFASIFIPLTFIAGVYGMNFEFIPELSFKYSYLIFWIVVIILGAGLLWYFKRKKWL